MPVGEPIVSEALVELPTETPKTTELEETLSWASMALPQLNRSPSLPGLEETWSWASMALPKLNRSQSLPPGGAERSKPEESNCSSSSLLPAGKAQSEFGQQELSRSSDPSDWDAGGDQ